MTTVLVRARPGRIAYTAPSNGQLIPENKWLRTSLTRWLEKLANKHGDIEMREFGGKEPVDPQATPEPEPPQQSELSFGVSVEAPITGSRRKGRAAQS